MGWLLFGEGFPIVRDRFSRAFRIFDLALVWAGGVLDPRQTETEVLAESSECLGLRPFCLPRTKVLHRLRRKTGLPCHLDVALAGVNPAIDEDAAKPFGLDFVRIVVTDISCHCVTPALLALTQVNSNNNMTFIQ